MTGDDLARLLTAAAAEAEAAAPAVDPLDELVRARRRRGQRRAHLATLSFVVFVLALQSAAPDAAGATRGTGSGAAVTAAADVPSRAVGVVARHG